MGRATLKGIMGRIELEFLPKPRRHQSCFQHILGEKIEKQSQRVKFRKALHSQSRPVDAARVWSLGRLRGEDLDVLNT